MICAPSQQELHSRRSDLSGSQIPADFPISARPLRSVPPVSKMHANGGGCNEEKSGGGEDEKKKKEREHKRRSKNWTRIETQKLIRFRSELEPRFSGNGRKSGLWDEIAELLRGESISRDSQQCRDKWEKLTAGYKEVRDGVRLKEYFPFFDDLDLILSVRSHRLESQRVEMDDSGSDFEDRDPTARKRQRASSDRGDPLEAMKELLESLLANQQRVFVDLLESIERRERVRQEREEKWREEDRERQLAFQNAMILLAKKIAGEGNSKGGETAAVGSKKRSKNWKRAEVLVLIKARKEMEEKFEKSTRRAALWNELAGLMCAEGVRRNGKQCREKWDKLMAELKDVADGKRDRSDSPYFADLLARGFGTSE